MYPLGGFLDKEYFCVGAPAQNLQKQQYLPINCKVCAFNDYVFGLTLALWSVRRPGTIFKAKSSSMSIQFEVRVTFIKNRCSVICCIGGKCVLAMFQAVRFSTVNNCLKQKTQRKFRAHLGSRQTLLYLIWCIMSFLTNIFCS